MENKKDFFFDDAVGGHGEARSEPMVSDVSSAISKPKWRRLLRAAAQALSKPLADGSDVSGLVSEWGDAFYHPDASGGGTEVDMYNFLRTMLEDLNLCDEDTGTVLIGVYHFLQSEDLPVSAKTWRPLMVTALLASLDLCLRERGKPVKSQVLRQVAHWWPSDKARHAYEVFTSRDSFKRALLTPSVRANCYFNLRDQGLAMSDSAETTTAVVSFSQGPIHHSTASVRSSPRRAAGPPLPSGGVPHRSSSRDRSMNSFNSQETSFMLSADSSVWSEDPDVVSL